MNRREALASVSVLLGGAIIGAEVFLSGCKNKAASTSLFNTDDIALLDDIAETIIPATPDSGGGKAANTGAFMQQIVTDCYTKTEQEHFIKGIGAFKDACEAKYKKHLPAYQLLKRKLFNGALQRSQCVQGNGSL
ncbi:gluconate 2-dehydrogenase subunit 3 family protein [Niabella sp. W65]|nr:gluconate 2-dehydrogenase subunit 3 family protein [Niabella sp. W65]MCH7362036.1 gluconate 2-dehydrogenase subunit 3 family protein [Niabella sp. W65]ULT45795.1 gluconate 2-dehydrogenase subunit 3 family protein [Niabella sp. I65]